MDFPFKEPGLAYRVHSKWGKRQGTGGLTSRAWLAVALLAACTSLARAQAVDEDHEQSVTRTVVGIIGYTRWPTESPVLRLCLVGATDYAEGLLNGPARTVGNQRLEVRRVASADARGLAECEGLYVGQLEDSVWRGLMEQLAGRPLLTISERGELCRIGAMFCLRRRGEGAGFEVSLDSVARSGLRINPKVLQLARHRSAP